MKKYWNLISDEADKLFEVGIVNNDNDVLLTAARIRGAFLLASTEPAPVADLPKVQPVKARRRRAMSGKSSADHANEIIDKVKCPVCDALSGQVCVGIKDPSKPLAYIHGARTPHGNRNLKNKITGAPTPMPTFTSSAEFVNQL